MLFEQLNPGPHKTYLVGDEDSREAMIVDPLLENVEGYISRLHALGLRATKVLDTHTHADHLTGCWQLAKQMRAEYVMHELSRARCLDQRVTNGDILTLGELPIDIIHTPGHTADSISLIVEGRLLVGDVLFIGGAGRSDLPGGDPDEHWQTLHRSLASFPDSTLFFPAHDYRGRDFSSLGHERRTNPHYEHKDRYSYVMWQEDLREPTPHWMFDVIEANLMCEPIPGGVEEGEATCEGRVSVDNLMRTAQQPKDLGVIRLYERIERGKNPILMLDVRREEEYRGPLGHIEGTYHVPLEEMEGRMAELEPFRHSEVVTICRTDRRATAAALDLRDRGFEDVKVLRGGMIAWNSRGYRVDH